MLEKAECPARQDQYQVELQRVENPIHSMNQKLLLPEY
jgi:hypothetical protein